MLLTFCGGYYLSGCLRADGLSSVVSGIIRILRVSVLIEKAEEYRVEQRLTINSTVWFSGDGTERLPGVMIDISSQTMAFCCGSDGGCPWPGKEITMRFHVPRLGPSPFQSQVSFSRKCKVSRVEDINGSFRKVVVSFERPLFFKPAEQGFSESEAKQRIEAMV